jgi:hypothetical protein
MLQCNGDGLKLSLPQPLSRLVVPGFAEKDAKESYFFSVEYMKRLESLAQGLFFCSTRQRLRVGAGRDEESVDS